MVSSASFWDGMSEKYAAQPVKNEEGYSDTLQIIRRHLPPSARVLEVGGGTGSTALRLANSVETFVCTDVSPAMMAIAKRKADAADVRNITFATAEIGKTPGTDDEYDAVLALNLLHLVPDPLAALHILCSKLKKGGLLVSKTHALAGKPLLRIVVPIMRFLGQAPALTYFSRDELSKMHEETGFEIVESKDYENGERRLIVARKL